MSNARANRFVANSVTDSRRASTLFHHRSLVEGNRFERNSTGIVARNSEGLLIRNNRILHAMDPAGAGVALAKPRPPWSSATRSCTAPTASWPTRRPTPLNRIVFADNRIAHNITGIYFYGPKGRPYRHQQPLPEQPLAGQHHRRRRPHGRHLDWQLVGRL